MEITKSLYKKINFCISCGYRLIITTDRENKIRPVCKHCGWVYYKNPIPASCTIILNKNKEVLLIKRKFAPQKGKWALPSGYIEINQSPSQAAIQETIEETNLYCRIDKFLGYHVGYSPIYTSIISFGFLMCNIKGSPKAGDDAIDIKYEKIDSCDYVAFASHRHFIKIVKKMIS